jgi:hypothetical protein
MRMLNYLLRSSHQTNEEGEIDLTPEVLMQTTDNKYNGLKQSGRWNQPSEKDKKIIALEAQIKELVVVAKKSKKVPNGKPLLVTGE